MSIFKRSSTEQQTTAAAAAEPAHADQAGMPGVVPPPAAPLYSMRLPDGMAPTDVDAAGAEKIKKAREAQQIAQERIRLAVQRARAAGSATRQRIVQRAAQPAPAAQVRPAFDPAACAQAGMLALAWKWQESGAPIRAIKTYMDLLRRYPDTPAASAAVADLVELSEKLAGEGQFHTALAIYDHLEYLA